MTRPSLTALLTGVALALSACASTPAPRPDSAGLYARPAGSAPATSNATPYSRALFCIGEQARLARRPSPVIAVGRVADYTGKQEDNMGGPKLTQGGSLMAISALAKAGAEIVERVDVQVPEMELRYANNKLIGDDPVPAGAYRPVRPGQYLGSDYVIVGGITELNYNIRSASAEAGVGGGGKEAARAVLGGRSYVMNIGVDLRLVDTRTMRVVDVVSYQKQIYGREVGGGGFAFMGSRVIDISAGQGELEPLQLGVRSLIERATVEFMARLYGLSPDPCLAYSGDPLAPGAV
jgi:curli biogenesis system outer membrane secretion channel CsgG